MEKDKDFYTVQGVCADLIDGHKLVKIGFRGERTLRIIERAPILFVNEQWLMIPEGVWFDKTFRKESPKQTV